jgi:hypothetical protein
MSIQTLSLTIRPAGRLGWVLTINGTAYAHGTQAYCIRAADTVRRAFSLHGWAAFPDLPRKEARHG